MFSRLGWGVIDQGVSSLSNFALGIVVARSLGSEGFGAFTLAYVTYSLVLNASRGLATDPLLVRFSGKPTPAWRRAVGAAAATAVAVGTVAGITCVLVGLLLPGDLRGAFVALGVVLPALMLQDSWRFAFFSVGRPVKALVNDTVWGATLMLALAALVLTDRAGVVPYVLAFGCTAGVAGVLGLFQSRTRPSVHDVSGWLHTTKALGTRYLVENISIGAARQIRMTALGALAGLVAVGEVRAAEIFMGPFLVILMGVSQLAVPEASQVLARNPARLSRFCLVLGGAQSAAASLWAVAMLVLLPTGLGELLIGEVWEPAAALLPVVALGMVLGGLEIGAAAGVRALGAAPRSLVAQVTTASMYVIGSTVGAVVDGARGSCWGVVFGTAIGVVVWWVQLHRAIAEHVPAPAGPTPEPRDQARVAAS
jgi:O-antigen/teichoic acid export membrane protein